MKKTVLLVVTAALATWATGCSSSTSGTSTSGGSTGHTGTTTGSGSSTGGGSTTGASTSSGTSTGSHSGSSSSGSGSSSSSGGSTGGGSSTGGATGGLASVLLVDNDGRPGGSTPDIPLTLADGWLTAAGIPHDIYQEPANGTDQTDIDPQDPQLKGIDTIVWVTGDNWGDGDPTVSNAQQTSLEAWLDEGGKTLVLFSPGSTSSLGVNNWTTAETNTFLTQYVGITNDLSDPSFNVAPSIDLVDSSMPWYPVTGSSTVPAFSGKSWTVENHHADSGSVTDYLAALQPAAGIDVLATVQADPSGSATANATVPVAVGNKAAGKKKTSTVVFVGVSFENLASNLPTGNVQCDFLEAVRTYAALGSAESNCGITLPTGTATSPTLLVDNTFQTTPQTAPIFQNWLTGLGGTYATYTEPTTDYDDVDPSAPGLAGLSTIVWASGSNWGDGTPVISPPQQALLAQWLDEGGKTLVLFTAALPSDFGRNDWSSPETNPFLANYVGLAEDWEGFPVFVATPAPGADQPVDQQSSLVVTGSAGFTGFARKQWTVTNNNQTSGNQISFWNSVVQPLSSTGDVLATVQADPTASGAANSATPMVFGNKHVGAKGTSTIVYVGFTVENVADTIPGMNLQSEFFAAVASYAAVP